MIVHDYAQGGPEWVQARLGMPTASGFHRIFQGTRRKPSKQRDIYLLELVDEWITGKREEPFENGWTRRGRELEAEARFGYTMETRAAVREVGFVTRDDGLVGCSPDGLIGDDVVLEIKCPSPSVHQTYADKDPQKHKAQCQGQLYICERQRVHLWVYSDTSESVLKVIERDDNYISEFVPVLNQFLADLTEAKEQVAHCRYDNSLALLG